MQQTIASDAQTQTNNAELLQQAVYSVKEQNRLEGHTGFISSVVFSGDGKTLASASNDKTILLWSLDTDFDPGDLQRRGCQWVRNYLQNNPNVRESDRHVCNGIAVEP